MSGPGSIEIRRRLPAPVAEVFAWWTQPDKLRQWMSPVGIAEAVVDLRVGGAFQIVMRSGDVAIHHTGEFTVIEAPHRLAFTWASPYTGVEPSVVTVELEADGEDATQVRIVHSALPSASAASHRDGWGTMLDRLSAFLEVEGAKWPSMS